MSERLFLAVPPAVLLRERLSVLQGDLKGRATFQKLTLQTRWIPAENLHLTLHFLGDVPTATTPLLRQSLAELALPSGFPYRQELTELKTFPHAGAATVLVIGGDADGSPLAEVYHAMKPVLAGLGITLERRPYSPHITLARFRRPVRLDPAAEPAPVLTLEIGSFALYRSRKGHGGSHYEMIQEFPLAGRLSA